MTPQGTPPPAPPLPLRERPGEGWQHAPILALDSAAGMCAAGLVADGVLIGERIEHLERGQAARLPMMVHDLMATAAIPPGLIAATVGPGSFTGIRAGLALAHGLAAGWSCPLVGVTCIEALALEAAETTGAPLPAIWVTLHGRTGQVFLGRGDRIDSLSLGALPCAPPNTILTGNAAPTVLEVLAARGEHPGHHAASTPSLRHIAAIGRARHRGEIPPCAAQPLYVEPPRAHLPFT